MGEVTVRGAGDHLTPDRAEFLHTVTKCNKFCRTHKSAANEIKTVNYIIDNKYVSITKLDAEYSLS